MCASELTAYLATGTLIAGRFRGPVQCSAHPTVSQPELDGTGQLARFFPEVQPVPTRVVLSVSVARSATLRDSVRVEFAGAEKAIFGSALPLEFGEVIQLAGQ